MSRSRAAWAAVAVLLAALVPAAPAAAAEVVTLPSSGEVAIEGRGFGHGRGMSQWGAYGAAVSGLSYERILAHYYRGAELVTRDDIQLRVRVTADTDDQTWVLHTAGTAAAAGDGAAQTLPSSLGGRPVTAWRVLAGRSGLVLQGYAREWYPVSLGAAAARGPIRFTSPTGVVRLMLGPTHREYRGAVEAVAVAPGVGTRVVTSLEAYLRSVVPAEMPASWPAAAVRAQAVAARSYARWQRTEEPGGWYDTCDSTRCQVFNGVADYTAAGALVRRYEHPDSDAAVAATAGRLLVHAGIPVFAQFGSANGGWTVRGSRPYLQAFEDPYDGVVSGSPHTWRSSFSAADVAAAFPRVGRPSAVTVTARDGLGAWGGRVAAVEIRGSAGSAEVTGEQFRIALGLRSAWWRVAG
ncbi:SpoIID/LytB domain-containing protein [Jiangella endophytica]|uniref:SpoIID/LytB domain-containing protein n=1 Tax=Jiangella endophytica TaxID=1623398 RepID=UPI000E34E43A|nr:SpoIID/LytB domain-containing protein [Jiangella endophytica]